MNTVLTQKEIVNRVAKNGEPYRYGIEEDEIESFLTERGYNLVSYHTAEDLEKKYFDNFKEKDRRLPRRFRKPLPQRVLS